MPTTRPPLARWVLLLAVIAGVIGMHILTPGDGPGHGMLPAAMAVDHHAAATGPEPPPVELSKTELSKTGLSMTELPSGSAHGDMAGCILFLVIGGAALLLLALCRPLPDAHADAHRARGLRLDLRRSGPPVGWPRLALNVIRV